MLIPLGKSYLDHNGDPSIATRESFNNFKISNIGSIAVYETEWFTCKHYNKETKNCMNYDNRPGMCRNHGHSNCPYKNCTLNKCVDDKIQKKC